MGKLEVYGSPSSKSEVIQKLSKFNRMFKFIIKILRLLFKALFKFKKTTRQTIALMSALEEQYHGKFTKSLIDKTSRYEAIQQIVINDAFTKLTGRGTTPYEQISNKLFFILTFLYDDIMDQNLLSEADLNQLLENPLNNQHTIFEAKVLVDVHLQLLQRTKQPEKYKLVLQAIHKAQKDSLTQFNAQITSPEILDITLRKGGFSFLMCSLYLDLPISKQMDDSWYQIGALLQFMDDMYDIYNDLQEGVHTFPNMANSYNELEYTFFIIVSDLKIAIQKLPFKTADKNKLITQLSFIPAFGYLALDNLKKLQDENGNFKKFNEYLRKSLIIDMEKPRNIFKLIGFAYKIEKSWM